MRLRLTPSTPSIRTCTEWSRGATDRPTVGGKSVRHGPRSRLHDYLRTGSAGSMSHRIGRAAGAHQIPGGGSSREYSKKNDVLALSRVGLISFRGGAHQGLIMRSSAEAIGETDLPDLCLNGSDRWDLPNRSLSRPGSRSFMPSGDVRCMPGSLALQAPFEGAGARSPCACV